MSNKTEVRRYRYRRSIGIAAIVSLMGLVVAAVAPAVDIGPDAYGYKATNKVTYSFLNIVGSGSRVLAGTDDGKATLDLGFSFQFYGVLYKSVCVSTNGLITMGACGTGDDFANGDMTAASPSDNQPAIAVYWSDLTFDGQGADGIYYQTLGSAGSRQFVVQWNNVLAQNSTNAMTFEAVLSEGANTVQLQYQSVDAGSSEVSKGKNATVGIRDTDGNKNGRVVQWSVNAPVLSENEAIQFALGVPRLAGSTGAKGKDSTGSYVELKLTNTGTGNAKNIKITGIVLRALAGTGSVTLNSPALPYTVANLDVGASVTIKVYVTVPATVTRYSMTENGTFQDVAGTSLSFSIAQSIFP